MDERFKYTGYLGYSMKEEYRNIILIQLIYVLIALFVALVLWLIFDDVQANINIHGWELGGAFAGFIFVWLSLRRVGLLDEMMRRAKRTVQAGIKLKPTNKDEYNVLFDGFTNCDFYAFNPPFKLEESGDHLYENAIVTHVKRYRECDVKSRYLFFDKAGYERAMCFFQEVERRIGPDGPKDCITIKFWENPPQLPGYTFFTGYKEGKPFCIFYPTVAMRDGLPALIIWIEGAKDFLSILEGHFHENWDKATPAPGDVTTP